VDNLDLLMEAVKQAGGIPWGVATGALAGEMLVLHMAMCPAHWNGPCLCEPTVYAYGLEYNTALFRMLIRGVCSN